MKISIIPAGMYMTNCYIIVDEKTNDSIIIDPGDAPNKILKAFKDTNSNLKFILLTHGHADHTAAVSELIKEYDIDVYMNEKDVKLINNGEYMFGKKEENANKYVNDNDELQFGSLKVKCIETPGHTPGGMCYLIDNFLFSGDTLFNNSVGRTDLPGGDFNALVDSVKKLIKLDDSTIVYPGHGGETTIEHEKMSNPFI
ncbi:MULTISPECIES: MBL fold metallo-hydrolase [Clostridium]|uniref:MBL fold metallo-hydrolase n=1 Tax=Clostridium TaxID=1485 RepID=UPI000826A091|nr:MULTISPECIES: MBL fold metallo-hydrolase [Clostridium]PJI09764.1 MBL fold metallo-hydrolase [Clostridium sp. CT7]